MSARSASQDADRPSVWRFRLLLATVESQHLFCRTYAAMLTSTLPMEVIGRLDLSEETLQCLQPWVDLCNSHPGLPSITALLMFADFMHRRPERPDSKASEAIAFDYMINFFGHIKRFCIFSNELASQDNNLDPLVFTYRSIIDLSERYLSAIFVVQLTTDLLFKALTRYLDDECMLPQG